MKKTWTLLAAAAALGCGGPAAQVGGTYTGSSDVFITSGERQSGSEFLTITQSGNKISFVVAGCSVVGYASGATSFALDPFKCTKFIGSQSFALDITEGTLTGNASSVNMNAKGKAKNGTREDPVTFTFSGSKQN